MISIMVIADSDIDEDHLPSMIDIMLFKYKDVNFIDNKLKYKKSFLKAMYKEYLKINPNNDLNISSFDDFIFKIFNICGFVGKDLITTSSDALFIDYEIDDIYKIHDVDMYEICEDIDYLIMKDGRVCEISDNKSKYNLINFLQKNICNDYIVIINGYN